MPDSNSPALVVAAGDLGTRVHAWTRFIPKEFHPVAGRPGITLLLEEIAGLGPAGDARRRSRRGSRRCR
jgi:UTP-glucose-1-phosphate uridylyltransferase